MKDEEGGFKYRAPGKSMYFLLSRTQAGPGRTVKQEQEKISRNHVQTFSGCSVHCTYLMVFMLVDMEMVPPAPHVPGVHLDCLPIGVDVVVPENT